MGISPGKDYLDYLVIHVRINVPYRNMMGVWGQNLPGLALSYIYVLNFLTEGLISQE